MSWPNRGASPTLSGIKGIGNPVSIAVPSGMTFTSVQWYRNGVAIAAPEGIANPYIQVAADIPAAGASNIILYLVLSGVQYSSSTYTNIAPPALPAVRLVATNWRYPTSNDVVANTTETIGRNVHTFGSGNCRNLRLRLPTASNGNGGDVLMGAFNGQFYLEFRGVTKPFLMSGSVTRDITSGEYGVETDSIDPAPWGLTEWPVSEEFFVRYKLIRANAAVSMAAGHVIAQDARNACFTYNPATVTSASAVDGVGAMTMTASQYLSPRSLGYCPMPIGEFVAPNGKVSVGLIGASMEDGATDLTWTAPLTSGRGFMRATRAADGVSNPIAGGCIATSGNSTTSIGGVNTITYDYYKYFTHIEESIGGNDLGALNGSTVRQKYFDIELFRRNLWAIMRTNSPGVKIACLIKPPCITASSDLFTTSAGQTIGTEWGMFNGSAVGDTTGLGEYYRTWNVDQVNTGPSSAFTGSINNVILTVTSLTLPGRRLYIGDTITATGYVGKISGQNVTAADGTGSYNVTPAVPTGIKSRNFVATVTPGTGCDYVFGPVDICYPGRRDLWRLASTTGLGLPGDAALGLPAPNGTGGNHPATNHYILLSRRLRREFLGIND